MSTGMVVCSTCRREVHQWGDMAVRRGWQHCEDQTPICGGDTATYPTTAGDVRGLYCGADGPPPLTP